MAGRTRTAREPSAKAADGPRYARRSALGWDPTPSSPLGLTARVAPSWGGQAQGGAEALWSNQMAYGMGSHRTAGVGACTPAPRRPRRGPNEEPAPHQPAH